jgi:hypothetical protein
MATSIRQIKASGGDDVDIAAWEAATDVALTTGTQYIGVCFNEAFAGAVTFAGATGTDSTTYRQLTGDDGTFGKAGTDQTFIPPVVAGKLRYLADGARATHTAQVFVVQEGYFRLYKMNLSVAAASYTTVIRLNDTNAIMSQCIIHRTNDANNLSNYPMVEIVRGHAANCLVYHGENSEMTGSKNYMAINTWYGTSKIYYCTVLRPDSTTGNEYGFDTLNKPSSTQVVTNTLCANHNTLDFDNRDVNPTYTWTYNCSSDVTADDEAGAGNIISSAYSTSSGIYIVDDGVTTTLDARITADSSCYQTGTDLTGDALSAELRLDEDILGTARHATTPCIGCFEVVAAAGGGLFMSQSPLDGLGVGGPFFRNPIG